MTKHSKGDEMGSSYRQDLNSGYMGIWETPLREAIDKIRFVITAIYESIGDDGQFDNAADDGGLAEKLSIAVRFIEEELPKSEKPKD